MKRNQVDKKQLIEVSNGGLLERRAFIKSGAMLLATVAAPPISQIAVANDLSSLPEHMKTPGIPSIEYGQPSIYEKEVQRKGVNFFQSGIFTGALTPLDKTKGIITPNGLHFSIHHNGIPDISPEDHQIMIHGMVDRPLKWNLSTLLNYPMISRIQFLECSGNSAANAVSDTPVLGSCTSIHGQVSCSEWTGVPLKFLLDEAGIKPNAQWIMCEGADGGSHVRNVPLQKMYDDAILAFYQNGERLRPDQGYPVRLFLPGFEGNMSVKWIHRMEVVDSPSQSKDEQSLYAEFTKEGKLHQFTFFMDVKSVITSPSGEQLLPENGIYEIAGLAWSGRGMVKRVEVSADGGKTWADATLEGPVMNKSFTRFTIPWKWNGHNTTLLSRATDELGHIQPTRSEWKAQYTNFTFNHYNAINAWHVSSTGKVSNVYV
tara:strand:- start:3050 stop:4339 length:1290 start_codon:yes stop_codon:yes gene_type:complete